MSSRGRTDLIRQLTSEEMKQEFKRITSAGREQRIQGYYNSNLVTETLNYQDNDASHGLVSPKNYGASIYGTKKEFAEARSGIWKTIASPKKAQVGSLTFYVE